MLVRILFFLQPIRRPRVIPKLKTSHRAYLPPLAMENRKKSDVNKRTQVGSNFFFFFCNQFVGRESFAKWKQVTERRSDHLPLKIGKNRIFETLHCALANINKRTQFGSNFFFLQPIRMPWVISALKKSPSEGKESDPGVFGIFVLLAFRRPRVLPAPKMPPSPAPAHHLKMKIGWKSD